MKVCHFLRKYSSSTLCSYHDVGTPHLEFNTKDYV